jgi:hypothetical protein
MIASSKSFLPFFSAAFNRAIWLQRKTRWTRGLIVRGEFMVDGLSMFNVVEGVVVIDVCRDEKSNATTSTLENSSHRPAQRLMQASVLHDIYTYVV